MLGILAWVGKFLSGDVLKALLTGYSEKLKSQNTSEKISADLQQTQDTLASQVVIAEESKWFPFVRWGFAFPFMVYDWKILIWDVVLKRGVTDTLRPEFWYLHMIVVGAYFGHSAIQKAFGGK